MSWVVVCLTCEPIKARMLSCSFSEPLRSLVCSVSASQDDGDRTPESWRQEFAENLIEGVGSCLSPPLESPKVPSWDCLCPRQGQG